MTAYEMRISVQTLDVCSSDIDMDSDTARLRLLLDNNTLANTPILKVTGNTYFSPGSQIELQARSDDFRTSAQGTRYTLINSGTWEDPQNLSVVSSSALLEVRNFGIERSEEHTSELQSLMRISYAVFCLTKKKKKTGNTQTT